MALRIAAGGHVENDARLAFLRLSSVRELHAELRLADSGRANDDGEAAGQQAAA